MKKKKFKIIDIYEVSDEYMKEHNLYNPVRIKMYWYESQQIVEGGLTKERAKKYKIGDIVYE